MTDFALVLFYPVSWQSSDLESACTIYWDYNWSPQEAVMSQWFYGSQRKEYKMLNQIPFGKFYLAIGFFKKHILRYYWGLKKTTSVLQTWWFDRHPVLSWEQKCMMGYEGSPVVVCRLELNVSIFHFPTFLRGPHWHYFILLYIQNNSLTTEKKNTTTKNVKNLWCLLNLVASFHQYWFLTPEDPTLHTFAYASVFRFCTLDSFQLHTVFTHKVLIPLVRSVCCRLDEWCHSLQVSLIQFFVRHQFSSKVMPE